MNQEWPSRNIVVFDLETLRTPEEVGGWKAQEMGLSVAVLYSYHDHRYLVYDKHNVKDMVSLLNSSGMVVGFNHTRFDYEVLRGLGYEIMPLRDYDILVESWKSDGLDPDTYDKHHAGYGLDIMAFSTVGSRKTGNGADAPRLWAEGRIAEVVTYCMNDVRLTKELFEHILEWQDVRLQGRRIRMRNPFANWE